MAGRKAIPTHLKVVRGNPGKRALNKDEPKPSAGTLVAPDWLTKAERLEFETLAERLAEIGLNSDSYTESVALAAQLQVEIIELSEVIEREGRTYCVITKSGDRMVRARPEWNLRAEARRHLQSLLAEFGLTPSAATRVKVEKKKPENPFTALMKARQAARRKG